MVAMTKEVKMYRRGITIGLAFLLVAAVLFMNVGCKKLNYNYLTANHHFSKANYAFTEQKYRDAIEEYELALKHNPDLVDAYRFLGESYKSIYKGIGDTSESNVERGQKALDAFETAYKINPDNKDVIFSLGDMYDKLQEFDKAEAMYLRILDLEPANVSNYYVVAEFYRRSTGGEEEGEEGEEKVGKTPAEKALEMYFRRIETDPENEQGYAYLAQFYDNTVPVPEFDKAYKYQSKRVDLDPENAEAWLAMGVNRWSKAFRLQNQLKRDERIALAEKSEEAIKKANELDPTYPEPYSWFSVLYKSVLAKIDPDRAERYEQMADRYIERFKEARKRQAERKKLEEELGEIR